MQGAGNHRAHGTLVFFRMRRKFFREVGALPALADLLRVDSGADDTAFAALTASKSLRRVYVAGSKITAGGIAVLKKANPHCVVTGAAEEEVRANAEEL